MPRFDPSDITVAALVVAAFGFGALGFGGFGREVSNALLFVAWLLTLLAVPVFYSIFDDLSEIRIFQKIGSFSEWLFGGVRKRFAAATSSLFGNS